MLAAVARKFLARGPVTVSTRKLCRSRRCCGAAKSDQAVEAGGVRHVLDIDAVSSRMAGEDVVAAELAAEMVGAERVAGEIHHLEVLKGGADVGVAGATPGGRWDVELRRSQEAME